MEVAWLVVAVLALIGGSIYQSGQNKQIAQPFEAQASDPQTARERLSAALSGDGWTVRSDWQASEAAHTAFFAPKNKLHQLVGEFGVRATVTDAGEVRVVLANDGAGIRSMFLGVIPLGPRVPIGGRDFLKLKRKLAAQAW